MYNMTTFDESICLRIRSFLDKTLTIKSEGIKSMFGDKELLSGTIN